MRSDQAQLLLSARMKLLKRQLLEWKTLLSNQKQVRNFAYESVTKEPRHFFDTTRIDADMAIRQARRLNNLVTSHREEFDQMQARHQQEDADLEQVIKAMRKD